MMQGDSKPAVAVAGCWLVASCRVHRAQQQREMRQSPPFLCSSRKSESGVQTDCQRQAARPSPAQSLTTPNRIDCTAGHKSLKGPPASQGDHYLCLHLCPREHPGLLLLLPRQEEGVTCGHTIWTAGHLQHGAAGSAEECSAGWHVSATWKERELTAPALRHKGAGRPCLQRGAHVGVVCVCDLRP